MSELQQLAEHSASRLRTYKSLRQKLIARASADPEHAALYRSILTSIHLTKNRYRSMSPNRFLHGYCILCVTPKDSVCRGAADQIQALNTVAGVELIRPSRSIFSL